MAEKIDTASLLAGVDIVSVIDARVALTKSGAEYEACCPFHTESTPSFKVSPKKQMYHCFGCGANGDAIGFLREHDGLSFLDACRALGANIPAADGAAPKPAPPVRRESVRDPATRSPWVSQSLAPADAHAPPAAHVKRGKPESIWCYRSADGGIHGYVYRFVKSDGGKEVLPLTWCVNSESGAAEWRWMAFAEPRPLYGLDALAVRLDAAVLVVEGEKCRDAAAEQLPELVVMSWPGGGKAVKKADWSPLAGRKVVLWADADAKRVPLSRDEKAALDGDDAIAAAQNEKPYLPLVEQPGVKTMAQVGEILLGMGCRVWSLAMPAPGVKPDGWDVADAVAEGLVGDELAGFIREHSVALAPADQGGDGPPEDDVDPDRAGAGKPEWMAGMVWKNRGALEDCRENVYFMLTQHPALVGVVAFDEFARRVVKRRLPPWGGELGEWTGDDDLALGLWMTQAARYLVKGEGTINAGVAMAARRERFHPVRAWLDGLPEWDGRRRLDRWLAECMGAEATAPEYLALVGRLFILGMVERVLKPGCKLDYMIIFEGAQGKGKSTALRVLGGEWFADTHLRIGDKDAFMQLDGVWLYEIGEMDAFNRSETTAVKAFVTTQVDRYREPYARRIIERPRQVAFGGSTNQSEYLKDATGNRRFWPVRCRHVIDLKKLEEWREQLFAEALDLVRKGKTCRPSRHEENEWIKPEQEAREIVDPWLYQLDDWLGAITQRDCHEFTSLELITKAIGLDIEKIDNNRGHATRIGNLMAKLGWAKGRRTTGRREWVYQRPAGVDPAPKPPTAAEVSARASRPAQAKSAVEGVFKGPDDVGF